jgi:hypothetical protein
MDEKFVGDVLLGSAVVAVAASRAVVAPLATVARPALARSRQLMAGRVPDRVAAALADRGGHARAELERVGGEVFRAAVRQVIVAVLAAVDLTDLVRRHVDLDALVRGVDVEAVVSRVDLDAAVSRVDLDAIAARVDVDAVAARVDLDGLASRLDLDAVPARVDPDAVAKRLDVEAVVARVDVNAAVGRLDLTEIALQVINAIDLPEILRESTGPAASEVVRGIRVEGAQADDAVSRVVDRLLRRERRRGSELR